MPGRGRCRPEVALTPLAWDGVAGAVQRMVPGAAGAGNRRLGKPYPRKHNSLLDCVQRRKYHFAPEKYLQLFEPRVWVMGRHQDLSSPSQALPEPASTRRDTGCARTRFSARVCTTALHPDAVFAAAIFVSSFVRSFFFFFD